MLNKVINFRNLILCPYFCSFFFLWQWRIQRFFGNTVFSRPIQGRSPKGHNRELSITIFSYKHAWTAWVGVIYYGKCNYGFINCIRHCVRGEFIQIKIKFIKIFSFSLIWDKNLGSHTGWLVVKPLWIHPCMIKLQSKLQLRETKQTGRIGYIRD